LFIIQLASYVVEILVSEKMSRKFLYGFATVFVIAILSVSVFWYSTNSGDHKPSPSPSQTPLQTPAETARPLPQVLDGSTIPKFVNQLTTPAVFVPTVTSDGDGNSVQKFSVDMTTFYEQMLPPGYPETKVFGYGGQAKDAVTGASLGYIRSSPGPTFEAHRGTPIQVTWTNKIEEEMFAVDPTLHWANPKGITATAPYAAFPPGIEQAQSPVPLVVHLHGAEARSDSDGYPEAWFTKNGIHGSAYTSVASAEDNAAVYYYPNTQPATTLWYHDHALGITRINILSGLAGMYLIRDANDPIAPLLPQGKHEVPLVIRDRSFNDDGSMYFPAEGANPETHPYWAPEFFGDVVCVNGKVWPNFDVAQGLYRFRVLDASNARFYNLSFSNGMAFTQIGSDGGYLKLLRQ
jgi:spore coat protein A, manganese oxidase